MYILKGHVDSIMCLQLNNQLIISASRDSYIRVWDRNTGTCLSVLHGVNSSLYCLLLDNDNNKVYSGGLDAKVRVYDLPEEFSSKFLSPKIFLYS